MATPRDTGPNWRCSRRRDRVMAGRASDRLSRTRSRTRLRGRAADPRRGRCRWPRVVRDSASAARIIAAAGPRGALHRPPLAVGVDQAGPVGAVLFTQMVHGRELLVRARRVADRIQCHYQLAGFGAGHPRPVVDAADAETVHHEVVPPLVDARPRGSAAQRTAEHRVVPLHRPAVLGHERIRMLGDRVAKAADGHLPLRLRIVEVVGERERAPQAVVDARAPGQQRLGLQAGRASGPGDFAAVELHAEHEVDGLA